MNSIPAQPKIILCTCPDMNTAEMLTRSLLEEKLVSCVNLIPQVQAHFQWEGKIEQASECLMILKTIQPFEKVEQHLLANHPYSCPEIIGLPIQHVTHAYLNWLQESAQEKQEQPPHDAH